MNILEIDGKKAYNVSCTNILVKVGNSQQKKNILEFSLIVSTMKAHSIKRRKL